MVLFKKDLQPYCFVVAEKIHQSVDAAQNLCLKLKFCHTVYVGALGMSLHDNLSAVCFEFSTTKLYSELLYAYVKLFHFV